MKYSLLILDETEGPMGTPIRKVHSEAAIREHIEVAQLAYLNAAVFVFECIEAGDKVNMVRRKDLE